MSRNLPWLHGGGGVLQKVIIIGADEKGLALLKILAGHSQFFIEGIFDENFDKPGIIEAKRRGIFFAREWKTYVNNNTHFIFNTTNSVEIANILMSNYGGMTIISEPIISLILHQEKLINKLSQLNEMRTLLEAIIHSSNDAISVVDENGKGLLINPAYTRLTGLQEKDIIGKPATTDIFRGESMHLQVLKTKNPVRGVKMLVGPHKKEVVVNVAPIIIDHELKGSIGIIHDMSEIRELSIQLQKAKERIRTLEAKYTFHDIVGHSRGMSLAIEQARKAAKTPATVLLRGESGTGKELFAHAIHNESDRKYTHFIRVNCAAISETLLESELFGYEEGAFSGAKRGGKKGLFEEANKGSIFLDEIGELSLHMQAKLLRVLQEREIVKVGGTKAIPVNVRIIAATNKNLEKEIEKGNFREDLYYRINRIPIHIPPLRERLEDIYSLSQRLIQKINHDYGRAVEGINIEAISILKTYHWPGNVRELENILGRAIIFMNYNEMIISPAHLPELELLIPIKEQLINQIDEKDLPLQELLNEYEKGIIQSVLHKHHGNKTKTANELGISLRNLYYKLDKLKIFS